MATKPTLNPNPRLTGGSDPLTLELPPRARSIGQVIKAPDSADLIAGVDAKPYPVWPDDRGYFLEVARLGEGLPEGFPVETTQISVALSYPGTIKAFHYHRYQTDFWVPAQGMFQVCPRRFAHGIAHVRCSQHALPRHTTALATADSARRGARLQSDRAWTGPADLRHGSPLQPRRRRAHRLRRCRDRLRLGRRSTNEAARHRRSGIHRLRLCSARAGLRPGGRGAEPRMR